MLHLRRISLSRGSKILLKESSFSLLEKQKVGVVGQNGCGKSSLFDLLLGKCSPDAGECEQRPSLRISHLAQEIPDTEDSALQYVLQADQEYWQLQQAIEQAQDNTNLSYYHERFLQIEGYSKPAKAASIMAGLGIPHGQQQDPVHRFSGGFIMRLNLARCLMKPADLLLLDEPTNHLDMEALFWLEKWLQQSPCSILLISHDREFLDAFATHILHIEQQTMKLYSGNYSRFEQLRAQELILQQSLYTKQQQKIQHMLDFVQRFGAKATKAKQAQSKLRTIEKMELVAQAQLDSPFTFQFFPCTTTNPLLLELNEIEVGYPSHPLLQKCHLQVKLRDRIGLLGPNGEGKSTLMKTLQGKLAPLQGNIQRKTHLRIGYYAQHQLEELEEEATPIETIQALSPETSEQSVRDFLGGFHFQKDTAMQKIRYFSGGEKARLALAKLIFQKPNLLLLDEPTNHLDLGMRAALEIALQSYEGAIILISHDRHLLQTCVQDFYLVYQQKLAPFSGDLEEYHQWIVRKTPEKKPTASCSSPLYKEQKSIQNRLKKLDQEIEKSQQRLLVIETALGSPELYEDSAKERLQALLQEQALLQKELQNKEEEWFSLI